MLTELWTVLTLAAIALAFPILTLRAFNRRRAYCGKNIKPCFWCQRDCTYHALVKVRHKGPVTGA